MIGRPSDDALWRSVDRTLRDVVLPQLDDEWARRSVIGLIGLAAYARARPGDPDEPSRRALAAALDSLSANRLVQPHWPSASPFKAAGAVLAAAVSDTTDDGAAAEARSVLRPLLVQQLETELAGDMVLAEPFRGRLPDA